MLRRFFRKEVEKRVIFRPPGTVKMRLPLSARAQFSLFEGTPKIIPNWSQSGAKMSPKSGRRRPEVAPRAFPKKCQKMTLKTERKGSQKGPQKSLKIMKKGYPKTWSITGGPLGRPRIDNGGTLGAMLVIFLCILMFPHVFLTFFV